MKSSLEQVEDFLGIEFPPVGNCRTGADGRVEAHIGKGEWILIGFATPGYDGSITITTSTVVSKDGVVFDVRA